jgi:selenium metabolism protein YedF
MLQAGGETLSIAVDDQVSVENIQRMAASLGWEATAEKTGDHFVLTLRKAAAAEGAPQPKISPPARGNDAKGSPESPDPLALSPSVTRGEESIEAAPARRPIANRTPGKQERMQTASKTLVLISSAVLGTGDEPLGRLLMRMFVKTLGELDRLPERMIFIHSGVRLTCEGSELIGDLRALEQRGVRVLSCGTCLDYYRLKDSLRVGRVSNMLEIAQSLFEADRLVRP